jgi:hypothetical protein
MVVFKKIKNKGEDVLIYNYVYYDYIFIDCLYSYILYESYSMVSRGDLSIGTNYLFVLNNEFFDRNKYTELLKDFSIYLDKMVKNLINEKISPKNYIDYYKFALTGCPLIVDSKGIISIIENILQKNMYDLLLQILRYFEEIKKGYSDNYGCFLDSFNEKCSFETYNLLDRVIFITPNLEDLVIKMNKEFGGKIQINQGPQK